MLKHGGTRVYRDVGVCWSFSIEKMGHVFNGLAGLRMVGAVPVPGGPGYALLPGEESNAQNAFFGHYSLHVILGLPF